MDGHSNEPLPWPAAALWAITLGSFFFLVYGACNYITSLRADVRSFVWDWERHIPFVSQMVIPYMSLDLFFVGAIFLCRRNEIKVHAQRVVTAILIAAACFLLFPLRFTFVRPPVSGLSGVLFDWLKLDAPYNQFPSLHIALCCIVWAPYGRRVRGPSRWALIAWFVLIGASALLTYQHHAIDILGGEILTVVVFYLFPWSAPADNETRARASNPKLALIYASGALILFTAAILLRPWGLLLLWPATSLALITVAYAGAGARIFRKRAGKLGWAATLLLGPYLAGARITHLLYRRSCDPWNQVTPNVLIGRKLTAAEAARLCELGVTAVLDLTPEYRQTRILSSQSYENLQIVDHTLPTLAHLRSAYTFIEQHSRSGKVYVHCALGFSRSAGIVAAWLLESGAASTVEDAIAMVRAARPKVVISQAWIGLLRQVERRAIQTHTAP